MVDARRKCFEKNQLAFFLPFATTKTWFAMLSVSQGWCATLKRRADVFLFSFFFRIKKCQQVNNQNIRINQAVGSRQINS